MGKISPVSSKYIVHTQIIIEGVVDRPDVVGAIFGQTEGLLGSELELRELQRNGRIGRIEVKLDTRQGKTQGVITIPSSLDKTETAIIAASLETIQRIGPCNAKVKVEKIEDVRISKRTFVIERAKELLRELTDTVLPDSQEITDEVAFSVRMMEIKEYGKDRLPAGPAIDESDEIIVVEGRADVLNLLKHGIKNVIAINGTSVPDTLKEISTRKVLTAFVDGDRGGDLIIRELVASAEIDYVIKAPDGKEVEELTKKEIHKAIRSKVAIEQVKMDINGKTDRIDIRPLVPREPREHREVREPREQREPRSVPQNTIVPLSPNQRSKSATVSKKELDTFKEMLDDLVGTRGAYILDKDGKVLGKVPCSELQATLKILPGVNAVIMDSIIDSELARIAERMKIKFLVGTDSKVNPREARIEILTRKDLVIAQQ